jgi:hypothetical protein
MSGMRRTRPRAVREFADEAYLPAMSWHGEEDEPIEIITMCGVLTFYLEGHRLRKTPPKYPLYNFHEHSTRTLRC